MQVRPEEQSNTNSYVLQLNKVRIEDPYWSEYIRLVRDVIVPYQWEALNDRIPEAEPSYAVRNFKIAAGEEQGEFGGMVFQDSDVAKWLEAVGYLLATGPDPELERVADGVVDLIARAQQEDGYLNTYFTLKEPDRRWSNLAECHELYCAGHMIEAAVSYYNATGKRKILDVVCKFADYIDTVFGTEPGKLQGYDGHQEIELALVKLYRTTGNDRYLKLSRYFLDQRGSQPHFYLEELEKRDGAVHFPQLDIAHDHAYSQSHRPVRQQDKAEGHAVRVVYMTTAMADVAAQTGDAELLQACRKLWRNIVSKQMYITGGIGSMAHGEAFSFDYDLPGDTAYAETCASIGLIFFARRMLEIEPIGEYADVMERALYNTVVSGMSRDGKKFFYVNPLEVHPDACGKNHIYDHVKPERQGWFGCACCPPNIARLLASLGEYIYTVRDRTVYAHLYIGGQAVFELDGQAVRIEQQSAYAWEGKTRMVVHTDIPTRFKLALRLPSWCGGRETLLLNGQPYAYEDADLEAGYAGIDRVWSDGDTLEIMFDMQVRRMKGHPHVRDAFGKTALQYGPFVYCMEEADNGPNLHQLCLPSGGKFAVRFNPDLLGGVNVIETTVIRRASEEWQDDLYRENSLAALNSEPLTGSFIPYFAWANRSVGEMAVWIRDC
ncbi:glycoside hydrolase family 127 protein [Cohnella fermenti]|uniref:glycoside hydrolase family 127 protein n=1 Tax=Cohnella fermenti TaxID=2565925 RepID=UPI001E333875|nr:beta-L-arabinofuranosidase domain-containing protein [Cohnella fermenti]